MLPSEKRSLWEPTSLLWPRACSGDMYSGVPMSTESVVCTVFESDSLLMPKSSTFTWSPTAVGTRKMFSGFRSRCTTPRPVGRLQRRADLPHDAGDLLEIERLAARARREALALEVFHHQVRLAGGQGVEVEHLHDVRVLQPRGDLGLALEAGQRLLGQLAIDVQHLDGDLLAGQPAVAGQPHLAHASAAELALDLVGLGDDDAGREQRGGLRS